MILELPIRTVNPLNNRRHWRTVAARAKKERRAVYLEILAHPQPLPCRPALVTLTRLSSREMDSDGLAASFKAVRDGIADAYQCDDARKSGLRFEYRQEKAKKFGVKIEIATEVNPGHPISAGSEAT